MLTANQSERIISDVTASDGANDPVDFTMYYHTDHLGSTGFLTDSTGAVNEHIEYTAWADVTSNNINMRRARAMATGCETWLEKNIQLTYNTNTVNIPKYMYTSKELDTQTHLYYFGARYYDPKTSLWVSTDPILGRYLDVSEKDMSSGGGYAGILDSKNMGLYTYCHQNPMIMVDPDGNIVITITKTGGGNFGYGFTYKQGIALGLGYKEKLQFGIVHTYSVDIKSDIDINIMGIEVEINFTKGANIKNIDNGGLAGLISGMWGNGEYGGSMALLPNLVAGASFGAGRDLTGNKYLSFSLSANINIGLVPFDFSVGGSWSTVDPISEQDIVDYLQWNVINNE